MTDVTQEDIKQLSAVVDELRKINEGKADQAAKAALESKANDLEMKLQAEQAKVVAKENEIKSLNEQLNEAEKKAREAKTSEEFTEVKDRIKSLEEKLVNAGKSAETKTKGAYKDTQEYKLLNTLAQYGEQMGLAKMDAKDAQRIGKGEDGGYLVQEGWANEILEEVRDVSPIRQYARVWTDRKNSLKIPVSKSVPMARYENEMDKAKEDIAKFGLENLVAYRQAISVPVTKDILNFASFDIASLVNRYVAEGYAISEGRKFILGEGNKEPEGFMNDTRIERVNSGNANSFTFDNVIELAGKIKAGYLAKNLNYFFNLATLSKLRTMKDTQGQYIWRAGGESQPTTINGFNYVILQDMPDIAANAEPIAFGDMYSAYSILDSTSMEMQIDNVTKFNEGLVLYNFARWNGGQVVMPEALKILKVKA